MSKLFGRALEFLAERTRWTAEGPAISITADEHAKLAGTRAGFRLLDERVMRLIVE